MIRASTLLSDTTDLKEHHNSLDLHESMKSLGIQSIDIELVDIYEDSPYVNVKAISASGRGRAVEQVLRRFMSYLG